jgi:hypothetical protein
VTYNIYPKVNDRFGTNQSFHTRSLSRHLKNRRSNIENFPLYILKALTVITCTMTALLLKKLFRAWISGKMNGTRITKEQVKN